MAAKRQRKLLTGSHGNSEETDKGLPRKAVRLQRKALSFILTSLSFVVLPSDNRGDVWEWEKKSLWAGSLKVVQVGLSCT